MSAIIYWQNPCELPMSFRCVKAFMHAFSGRFSGASLEGISFNFFVCFILNVSMGSAPKRKNIDIQRNTRVGLGCQFTSNLLSCHHIDSNIQLMCISLISLLGGMFTIHIQINSNWITKWNQDGYHRQVTSQHYTGVKNIFSFTSATCKCGRDENRRRENVRILLIEKRKKEKSCQGNVQIVD